jgi:hypothetical protein
MPVFVHRLATRTKTAVMVFEELGSKDLVTAARQLNAVWWSKWRVSLEARGGAIL